MKPRDLLQALMDRDDENPNSLAVKLKKADPETKTTQPQIHKFLAGTAREPRRATLEPLALHFGVPIDAFYDPAVAARVAADLGLVGAAAGQQPQVMESDPPAAYGMTPILAWEHANELPPGEFVLVPRLDILLIAGSGREQLELKLTQERPEAFRADWIREVRLKPNKLAAMRTSGESMEPTIHDGDSVLVDISQTKVIDGNVYALWYEGGERVKRLFALPGGGLRIASDNPRHPPIDLVPERAGDVRIIGRVVHRSGMGGL